MYSTFIDWYKNILLLILQHYFLSVVPSYILVGLPLFDIIIYIHNYIHTYIHNHYHNIYFTQFGDFSVQQISLYIYTDLRTQRSFHVHILVYNTYKHDFLCSYNIAVPERINIYIYIYIYIYICICIYIYIYVCIYIYIYIYIYI